MLARIDEAGVLLALLFAVATALLASSRGRNPVAWFLLGFLFSCFALILLLVLPDLKVEQQRHDEHAIETRRLREQLAKERMVADQRHQHVERRLGNHDQALGIDTREPPPLTHDTPPLLPDVGWFYAPARERLGPVSAATIRHLLQTKAIDGNTLVWCEGMKDWAPARSTPEFAGDCA